MLEVGLSYSNFTAAPPHQKMAKVAVYLCEAKVVKPVKIPKGVRIRQKKEDFLRA